MGVPPCWTFLQGGHFLHGWTFKQEKRDSDCLDIGWPVALQEEREREEEILDATGLFATIDWLSCIMKSKGKSRWKDEGC